MRKKLAVTLSANEIYEALMTDQHQPMSLRAVARMLGFSEGWVRQQIAKEVFPRPLTVEGTGDDRVRGLFFLRSQVAGLKKG